MTVTIYHNPACNTSRTTLALIRAAGITPVVVEYLKTPPDRQTLRGLARSIGVPLRDLLRRKEKFYAELGLSDPSLTEDTLLDALAAHPVLLERPIVVTPKGAGLCRPADKVLELLP